MNDPMTVGEEAALELLDEYFFPDLKAEPLTTDVRRWNRSELEQLRDTVKELIAVVTRIAVALESANQRGVRK